MFIADFSDVELIFFTELIYRKGHLIRPFKSDKSTSAYILSFSQLDCQRIRKIMPNNPPFRSVALWEPFRYTQKQA